MIASKLLRVAADYLAVEDRTAAQFTGKINTDSFAAAPAELRATEHGRRPADGHRQRRGR
jgi:hypothetical protein